MVHCSWARTECSSKSALKLKCRVPGYLGCYDGSQSTQVDSLLQGFSRHEVMNDLECATKCREQRNIADVAVIYQSACLCVPSEIFTQLSSLATHLRGGSCPRMEELNLSPGVYYAFNASYGFCDQLGVVQNGAWDSNSTWFGSLVTLTCDQGFIFDGSATLQCVGLPGRSTYFPAWNSSIPSCEVINTSETFCQHPGSVSYGKWNSTDTSLGSSITLTCDENYVINGSATLRCIRFPDNNSLDWSASLPTCLNLEKMFSGNVSKCNHPGKVLHGKWNSNTMRVGSTVTLVCDEGYIVSGSATLLCVTSSDENTSTYSPGWNASIPSCQPLGRLYS
ncbi:zona pellucida sperm-binding protein 3 receptor-like [Diadema setosum]|uniref:zona pellucida sperm-binding protein 3 receptor-like n=1 Tax=Diadema setosum TaxID=31175 RepID=UPI003B3B4C12